MTRRLPSTRPLALGLAVTAMTASCTDPPREGGATSGSAASTSAVVVNEVALALAANVKLDAEDPATCEACHGAVVAEWRESQHSRAHHASDGVYGALRALRTAKQGAAIPNKCATCHNPRAPEEHETPAAKTGVSCATCHQIDGVHLENGAKGVAALVPGPALRGPHDIPDGTSPVHATGSALTALTDGRTVCLACHGEEKNPAGVVTCATGVEHAAGGDAKPCASCHMDDVTGPSGAVSTRASHKSHRFRGPLLAARAGQPGILAEAIALSGAFEGEHFVAKLENRSGHAFPTGFPGRVAMLELRGLDDGGATIFENLADDPMKDHPEAVFNRAFVGADDKPAIAAFATREVRDTRLKPGETRAITVELPAAVHSVELRLRFVLVPKPLASALGYDGPETKPIRLAPVTIVR